MLEGHRAIFLIGCGECATQCCTGGEREIAAMAQLLRGHGKDVVGSAIPQAPCVAAQVKKELAQHAKAFQTAEAVLVLACGLGVQTVKDNERRGITVVPACNTLFGSSLDSKGNFYEKCSLCGECILDLTAARCPVTLCPKGMRNGPCSGVNNGKCEIDSDMDCVWILIYQELAQKGKEGALKKIQKPRNFKKAAKPRTLILH
ncbi:MAG: methylenetetrahydrofolate reductase C-terminal domain-containing protein [Candidatus Omnitrophota bacterium]